MDEEYDVIVCGTGTLLTGLEFACSAWFLERACGAL